MAGANRERQNKSRTERTMFGPDGQLNEGVSNDNMQQIVIPPLRYNETIPWSPFVRGIYTSVASYNFNVLKLEPV